LSAGRRAIRVFNTHGSKRQPVRRLKKLVELVLSRERSDWAGELNVVLCDDNAIRDLNVRFLAHDYPTDVLAFPLAESGREVDGEVYVSLDRAEEQAREAGVSFDNEVCRLVVHGVLHLLGHQDGDVHGATQMQARQEDYVRLFFAAESMREAEKRRGGC